MVAAAYVADQVIFCIFFWTLLVGFVLQLLVERKAKYDEQQWTAQERVREWKRVRRASSNPAVPIPGAPRPNNSVAVVREKSDPLSEPDNNTNSDRDVELADSESISAVDDLAAEKSPQRASVTAGTPPKRSLKVGPLQWCLHRIGLLICILECWIFIDPYTLHGILSYQHVALLSFNAAGLLFLTLVVCYYYPVHLVRFFALRKRSRPMEYCAIGLCVFSTIINNLFPALYSHNGPKNYLRAGADICWIFMVFTITVVFNIYMQQLGVSVQKLIDYHYEMQRLRVAVASNLPVNQPHTASGESTPPAVPRSASNQDLPDPRKSTDALLPSVPSSSSANLILSIPNSDSSPRVGPSGTSPTQTTSQSPHTTPSIAARKLRESLDNGSNKETAAQAAATKRIHDHNQQSIAQYQKMMKKMRRFQLISTVAMALIIIALIWVVATLMKHPDEDVTQSDPEDYKSSFSQLIIFILEAVVCGLIYWYSYMPVSVLWEK